MQSERNNAKDTYSLSTWPHFFSEYYWVWQSVRTVWQNFFSSFYTSMQRPFRTESTFITLRPCIFAHIQRWRLKIVVVFARQTRKVYFGFSLVFFSCVVVLWFCPVQGFFYIFQDKRIFHLPFQDYWKKRFWKKKNSQIENSEILEILFRVSWSPSLRFCPRAKTKISDLKYSEKISESFRGFLVFDSPD